MDFPGLLAVGGELNAQLRIPVAKRVHALVVGARGGLAASTANGTALGIANLDLGYRASFGSGPVTGGGFVAFNPGVWAGSKAFAAFGGTLGGFVRKLHAFAHGANTVSGESCCSARSGVFGVKVTGTSVNA